VSVTVDLPPAVVARIRERLEREREDIVHRLAATTSVDTPTATHGAGETEHVQLHVERAVAEALHGSARETLEDVAFALARLDDGSYGACSACGAPIPAARLEARPTTRRCVHCQERRERR
jgi:RNA polymerase-binding protein DksA